jgi:hypothetical protein
MDEPAHPPNSPSFKPMTLGLAGLAVLAAATSALPPELRYWNAAALGALMLFATARLPLAQAAPVIILALLVKEVAVYLQFGFLPSPATWLCMGGYAILGATLLRNTESPLRIGGTVLMASLLFFLTSNFGAWLEQARPYGYSFAGLMDCYIQGIPFYRGTLIGDTAYSAALFSAHFALSRSYFPAERPCAVAVKSSEQREESW